MEASTYQSQAQAWASLRRKRIVLIVIMILSGLSILGASALVMTASLDDPAFPGAAISILTGLMTIKAGCTGIAVLPVGGNVRMLICNYMTSCIAISTSFVGMYFACKSIRTEGMEVCEMDYWTVEETCRPLDAGPAIYLLAVLIVACLSCSLFVFLNVRARSNQSSSMPLQLNPQQAGHPFLPPASHPAPPVASYPASNSYPMHPYPTQPYPTIGAPYPTTTQPYPTVGAPYSATTQSYPTVGAPYPATTQSYPTVGAPYPATVQPYPTVSAPPYAPGPTQPYAQDTAYTEGKQSVIPQTVVGEKSSGKR